MACETNTPCTSEVLRSLGQKYPATKPSPPEFGVGFQPQMSGPDRDAPPSPSASRRIYNAAFSYLSQTRPETKERPNGACPPSRLHNNRPAYCSSKTLKAAYSIINATELQVTERTSLETSTVDSGHPLMLWEIFTTFLALCGTTFAFCYYQFSIAPRRNPLWMLCGPPRRSLFYSHMELVLK